MRLIRGNKKIKILMTVLVIICALLALAKFHVDRTDDDSIYRTVNHQKEEYTFLDRDISKKPNSPYIKFQSLYLLENPPDIDVDFALKEKTPEYEKYTALIDDHKLIITQYLPFSVRDMSSGIKEFNLYNLVFYYPFLDPYNEIAKKTFHTHKQQYNLFTPIKNYSYLSFRLLWAVTPVKETIMILTGNDNFSILDNYEKKENEPGRIRLITFGNKTICNTIIHILPQDEAGENILRRILKDIYIE